VTIKTITIVDMETDIVKQVKAILEKEDVEVVTATNSRQALNKLKEENEETFNLILINTRMPDSQKTTALFSLKPTFKNNQIASKISYRNHLPKNNWSNL
jgi:DNA-binding NtrC family response regulator